MAIPLTVTVNHLTQSVRLNARLVLGNSYTLTWAGTTLVSPQLVLVDEYANGLAESADGTLSLARQALVDKYPDEPGFNYAKTFSLYAVAQGVVVGSAQVFVFWSPLSFDVDDTPWTLKGDKGDKGDQGISAYDVAVLFGYEGTAEEWLLSLKGDPGPLPTLDDRPTANSDNAAKSGGIHQMLTWYAGKIPVAGTSTWQAVQYINIGGSLYLQRVGEPATPPWEL